MAQFFTIDAVAYLGRFDGALDEPRLLQFLEMLRYGGFGDGKHLVDVAEEAATLPGQEVEDGDPRRMAHCLRKAGKLFLFGRISSDFHGAVSLFANIRTIFGKANPMRFFASDRLRGLLRGGGGRLRIVFPSRHGVGLGGEDEEHERGADGQQEDHAEGDRGIDDQLVHVGFREGVVVDALHQLDEGIETAVGIHAGDHRQQGGDVEHRERAVGEPSEPL